MLRKYQIVLKYRAKNRVLRIVIKLVAWEAHNVLPGSMALVVTGVSGDDIFYVLCVCTTARNNYVLDKRYYIRPYVDSA